MRNNSSLKQAALDLNIKLDPDEAVRIGRRKDFIEILRVESNKYHAALANDPTRTKSVAIGKLWALAEKLEKDGEYEKAAATIEKACKAEGWIGGEGNVNIFGNVTARDLQEAKERIIKLRGESNKQELLN